MRDFLLEKNLWALDLFSSVSFGLGIAYLRRTAGRIIYQATWDRILFEMSLALAGYLAAFVIGLSLRKKLTFLRSWMWMGGLGTLAYFVIVHLVYFYPRNWKYYTLTSETTSLAVKNAFLGQLESVITVSILLTPFACLCILAARFIVYFTTHRYFNGENHVKSFK